MDRQAISNLPDFNPYDVCEARKLVEWTLGHCIAIANHHTCLCSASVDSHQGIDLLIFVSVHYPPTQAYHAQYLNINLMQPDFMDTIMDSVKSGIQLVQPQPTHPSCLMLWTSKPYCTYVSLYIIKQDNIKMD